MAGDPIAADPDGSLEPPASTPTVTFASGGETLYGVLHLPGGPGPHPVVVVLHGFPGYERNSDLAHALRRAGYAALVAHYRGSWGVGGAYSFTHVLEDAAVLARGVREPGFAATHRLDPDRVALVGHSLGGFAALQTAAADPGVRAVAALAFADMGAIGIASADPAFRELFLAAMADGWLLPLAGTTAEALEDELVAHGEEWLLAHLAPALAGRPVLLAAAERDEVAWPDMHYKPVVAAYAETVRPRTRLFPTDHGFSDQRIALAREVLDFLAEALPVNS